MRRDRTKWWLVVAYGVTLIAAGMVFKLADAVHESDAVVRSDTRIMRYVIDHRSPLLSSIARVITQLGSGWIVGPIVVVSVAALLLKRQLRGAFVLASSSIGSAVMVTVAKELVGRPRPPAAARLVTAHGLAFPSGHAAQSVACYGALAWLAFERSASRRVRVFTSVSATLIAVIVGLSRVYLGVHWPSDVLSGWLIGVGWLAALIGWSSRRTHRRRDRAGHGVSQLGSDPTADGHGAAPRPSSSSERDELTDHDPALRRELAWPTLNGIFDVVAGITMLLSGFPTGWSLLVCGCGVALLVGTWTLTSGTKVAVRPATVAFGFAGTACLVLAVMYLTRDADAIPRLMPGYDADSERWRLLPGALSLMISAVMIPATWASSVPAS